MNTKCEIVLKIYLNLLYLFVFQTEWAWGAETLRDNMQTLAPQLKVDFSVIDSFACVLSYEETITNSGSKIKQFFHTGILTTPIVEAKKEDEEKQYKEFCANLTSVFKGNPDDNSMHHVELAFFPIIAHEHFYLVVFNLPKGTSVIIDNSSSGATYESKYSKECDILKKLFSRYLESHKHKKAYDISTKRQQ
ncbi:Peptidase C48, SUMO/Sentrin/Ubl1 [Artemisia annua]|uniref:Peptidase C48, SUMO/Sentrin/Ubl1 n=1 Tax=Artemisia annua TaxID=35608 RepID=A0A2U1NV45_ARTAN|nr:Peptidase C48, SUMO/Sentrin/Ubl1 [Artemisia annua]